MLSLKRAFAFCVDWCIVWGIGGILFSVGPRFNVSYLLYPSVEMFSAYGFILGIIWLLLAPVFRDFFCGGSSIGKRIFHLSIVEPGTNIKAQSTKIIIRNITFYFPIIELCFLLFNKGKTIGDIISHSAIVSQK